MRRSPNASTSKMRTGKEDSCMEAVSSQPSALARSAADIRVVRKLTADSSSASDQRRIPRQVLGHVLVVGLEGAAADLEQLGVAPQALDDVFAHVAVAAEDLDGAVGDLLADAGGEELGAVGVDPVAVVVEVELAGGLVHVAARGPVFG